MDTEKLDSLIDSMTEEEKHRFNSVLEQVNAEKKDTGHEMHMKKDMPMPDEEKKLDQDDEPPMLQKKDQVHQAGIEQEKKDQEEELKKKADQARNGLKPPTAENAQAAPLQNAHAQYTSQTTQAAPTKGDSMVGDAFAKHMETQMDERYELRTICDSLGYEHKGRTNYEIKYGLVKTMAPEINLKGKNQAFVDGVFHSIKDKLVNSNQLDTALADIGSHYQKNLFNPYPSNSHSYDRLDAADRYMEKRKKLWELPNEKAWNDHAHTAMTKGI